MATYHFIRHNKEIELFGNCCNAFKFRLGENLADRVVWCIHDNHLGSRGYGASLRGEYAVLNIEFSY